MLVSAEMARLPLATSLRTAWTYVPWAGLLVLVACSPAERAAPPEQPPSLSGTEWRLASLGGALLAAGAEVTLEIDDGRLGGYSGCNWYGAEYAEVDGRLDVGQTEGTARGCADAALDQQEAAYLRSLGEVASYRTTERELVLEDERGRELLRFTRHVPLAMDPAELVGTRWRLLETDGAPPPERVAVSLEFGEATFQGFAGCRGFTGAFGAEGEKIHVTRLAMNDTECADASLHDAEHRFLSVLSEAARYRLGDGRLVLTTDSGRTLVLAADGGPRQPEGPGAGR
jgi:putative lipoprotein